MDQDERDARLGFRALAAAGSIPPTPPRSATRVRIIGENPETRRRLTPESVSALVDLVDDAPPGPSGPRYPSVTVKLSGEDGNVYAIIGRIKRALLLAERDSLVPAGAAAQWLADAMACRSYDAVLRLAMQTVEVE